MTMSRILTQSCFKIRPARTVTHISSKTLSQTPFLPFRRPFHPSTTFRMPNEPTGDPKQHHADKFKDSLTGSCLCGSVTVTINDNELFTKKRGHLCHCSNCRKVAGSYVASNLLIEQEKVTIEDKNGTLKTYEDKDTLSGNPVYRTFCSTDGNPVKSETAAYPGKVVLKMGMFPRIPQPEAESFGLHKHEWQGAHDAIETYEIKWAGPDKKLMSVGK